MAFPAIQTADTKFGTVTANSTSWTLTYPTNIAAGDLLLLFVASDGVPNLTLAGWTQLVGIGNAAGANRIFVFSKLAAGTETGTFTLTLDATEQGAWRIFRITGWFGGSVANNDTSLATTAQPNGSPSATPTLATSLNPSGWDIEDTLWLAACSVDTSRTISAYPLASNQTADVSGGSTGATLGLCTTNSTVASLGGSAFTISTSDDWVTATVAVRPAAAGPPGTVGGTQPAASGSLTRVRTTARSLQGRQPALGVAFSDTFTRANSSTSLGTPTPGPGGWSAQIGTWGITANRGQNFSTTPVNDIAIVTPTQYLNAEVSAEIEWHGQPGLVVLYGGANYLVVRDSWLWKVASGVFTQLVSLSNGISGFVICSLRVVIEYPTYTIYMNEVQVGSYTLSSAEQLVYRVPNYVGIYENNATKSQFDNFLVLATPPGTLSARIPLHRDVSGTQPAASGTLSLRKQTARALVGQQAVGTPLAADTFNRADSASSLGVSSGGQTWVPLFGTWGIQSNQAQDFSTTPNQDVAVLDGASPDGTYTIDLTIPVGGDSGVVVRAIDYNNFLLVHPTNLFKKDGGSYTSLATYSQGMVPGSLSAVRVLLNGPQLRIAINDVEVLAYTLTGGDATKFTTPTLVGLREHSNNRTVWDNLAVIRWSGASGTLAVVKTGATRTVTGAQPAASGTLARLKSALRSTTGLQPASTGTVTRLLTAVRSLTGAQLAATGTLARSQGRTRSLTGSQPAAGGTLTRLLLALRSLSGSQLASTGTLTRRLQALRSLTGSQPFATGALTRQAALLRSLTGAQPFASGALSRLQAALRSLTSTQPAPTGTLAAQRLISTQTRSVPLSVALLTSGVRVVPLSATLGAFFARTVPLSAALSQTTSRVVPLTGALQGTATRLVPLSVALTSTGVRAVPLSATLGAFLARTVPLSTALSAVVTHQVPLTVALGTTFSRTVPFTGAVGVTGVRTVPLTGALRSTGVRSVPFDAAVYLPTYIRVVPISGALSAVVTRSVPLTASVGQVLVRTVPLSVALLTTGVRTVPLSGTLTGQLLRLVPLTSALKATELRSVPLTTTLALTSLRVVPLSGTLTYRFILEDVDSPTRALVSSVGESTASVVETSVLVAVDLPSSTTPELTVSGATRANIRPGGYP